MVSAKVFLVFAVCALVMIATAEANAHKDAGAKKARANLEPHEHLQKMRKRMSLISNLAKSMARDGPGEEDDPDSAAEPKLMTCYKGYKAEKCTDDEEEFEA